MYFLEILDEADIEQVGFARTLSQFGETVYDHLKMFLLL